jgi:predicted O-linked N-acetylglucosamine transferase (SPINDLY family)
MQTRRRTRGGGHGKPSAKQYRKSLRRLEQSIRNANAAAQAAFNAKRMSRRKGMRNIANSMNVGVNLRRSSRRTIQSATMKSIRERAANQRAKNMKKMAQSYQKIIKNAKATEKAAMAAANARSENELSRMMRSMGF